MITIDTKKNLTNLKGDILKDAGSDMNIGTVISFTLSMTKSTNPWKSYLLAKKFADSENVEISEEDSKFISSVFETTELWTPLVIGQVMEVLTVNQ